MKDDRTGSILLTVFLAVIAVWVLLWLLRIVGGLLSSMAVIVIVVLGLALLVRTLRRGR
jgi:hypothetical protein